MPGKIYVLSSSIFKDNIYKVGRSRNFPNRLKSYKTSFGTDPIVHMERDVKYDELIEKLIHIKLIKYRFKDNNDNYSREHYYIELPDLIEKINEIIAYVGIDDLVDEDLVDEDSVDEEEIENNKFPF